MQEIHPFSEMHPYPFPQPQGYHAPFQSPPIHPMPHLHPAFNTPPLLYAGSPAPDGYLPHFRADGFPPPPPLPPAFAQDHWMHPGHPTSYPFASQHLIGPPHEPVGSIYQPLQELTVGCMEPFSHRSPSSTRRDRRNVQYKGSSRWSHTHATASGEGDRGGESNEKNQLDLEKIESGTDTRTTLMIKNIPNKMSDKDLLDFINRVCPRRIDFLYLRVDFKNGQWAL